MSDKNTPTTNATASTAKTSAGKPKSSSGKSSRTRAREFAVQALYQFLVGRNDQTAVDEFTRNLVGFNKCDQAFFNTLLSGCIEHQTALLALITPSLDRKLAEVSPIELSVLLIGAFELSHIPEIPWKVVINEEVELAKEFGGSDGHKYVNGVLNRMARETRADEINANFDASK
jgi:N utilization substance protein B